MKKKFVFATNNAHKLEEVTAILGDKIELLSMKDIHCSADIPETADTLEGNALLKARYIFENYHLDCFADDTGLEVEALNGLPECIRHAMPAMHTIQKPICRSCCRIWKEWRTEKPDSVPFSHLSSMERNTCSKAS